MSLLRVENCNGQGLVRVLDWPGKPPGEKLTRRALLTTRLAGVYESEVESGRIAATYRFPDPDMSDSDVFDMPDALRVA